MLRSTNTRRVFSYYIVATDGIMWDDGQGMWPFAKRLGRGRFIWPSTVSGSTADTVVTITHRALAQYAAAA
jgi:hypothetical protein